MMIMQSEMDVQEELGVTTTDCLQQGIPVRWGLGDRFAERKRVDIALLARKVKMVCGNGSWFIVSHRRATPGLYMES